MKAVGEIGAIYEPPPRERIWEWGRRNIDFRLAPNYDTPLKAPFDPDYAPYMKQILDDWQDLTVREIWIRKCSRAAATEYILTAMRYTVAVDPAPTYYLTSDQLTTERFMETRIKRGFHACPAAMAYYRKANETQHDIRFPHMDLRVSWPNAKGAFKQDGWARIIADELSTWQDYATEMLRKRAGTYPFHTIVGLSSPDPKRKGRPEDDPIIQEYQHTNRCVWMMRDPKTGNDFTWQFGGADDAHGLKWPADAKDAESGEWNMERVRSEAYYLTPDGTRIYDKDRIAVMHTGRWVAQRPDAPKHVTGYWITGPMVPFADGDFGTLAYRFIHAKARGTAELRAYFMENWADVGELPNDDRMSDRALMDRERNYQRGDAFWTAPEIIVPEKFNTALFITCDVQKYHIWWLTRWWLWTGERVESGLEEFGTASCFDDLGGVIERCKPARGAIDLHYEGRFTETAVFCAEWSLTGLMGDDKLKKDYDPREGLDPYEGSRVRRKAGLTYSSVTWNTDVFRTMLLGAIRGESEFVWVVPKMPPWEYVKQVTSTEKVGGEWVRRKGHPDDHLWDCEAEQLVMARVEGLI